MSAARTMALTAPGFDKSHFSWRPGRPLTRVSFWYRPPEPFPGVLLAGAGGALAWKPFDKERSRGVKRPGCAPAVLRLRLPHS